MPTELRRIVALSSLILLLSSCRSDREKQPVPFSHLESRYVQLRDLRDAIDVARSRGLSSMDSTPLEKLEAGYRSQKESFQNQLEAVDPAKLDPADSSAVAGIKLRLSSLGLGDDAHRETEEEKDPCSFSAASVARDSGLDGILERTYECFGATASNLPLEGDVFDRLSILERLTLEPDRMKRQRLFFALQPLWQAVHDRPDGNSPYSEIIRLSSARRNQSGNPIESAAELLGVSRDRVEPWLVSVLDAWKRAAVREPIEPWDYYFLGGEAGRELGSALPSESLRQINDRYYSDLGADPVPLGLRYDLEPRPGKTPVAFTTFGRRNRQNENGEWQQGEFWIFATYREGGLGNLAELLHETGHGVHIAAIRTRPAFQDWPDSDIFTEAVADLVSWNAYDSQWQQDYLGRAASTEANLRAKYSAVMLDIAWSLFEIRLHQDPSQEPNRVWADITSQYLGIRPHPDLAWWALRGQLVSSPGYMLNYALGAILVADLREEIDRRLQGRPPHEWYALVSEHLFQYGVEKPAAAVIKDFLGRPTRPDALRTDLESAIE